MFAWRGYWAVDRHLRTSASERRKGNEILKVRDMTNRQSSGNRHPDGVLDSDSQETKMKHLVLAAFLIALAACETTERETETIQSGIVISGTASMGIARDGN